MLVGITFAVLFIWVLVVASERAQLRQKTLFEWVLDSSNLTIQGTLVPLLQTTVLFTALAYFWPEGRGSLIVSNGVGFCLNFFGVDYLYYWNHRLLHHRRVFPLHVVHHTVKHMDVFATSRNSLMTSFFIVYLWLNGFLLYITDLNTGILFGMSLSAALDLWKHSSLGKGHPRFQHRLSQVGIMTPLDHAWHHAQRLNKNYGANLNWYDRLHGTYYGSEVYPERMGVKTPLKPWQQLLFPFS